MSVVTAIMLLVVELVMCKKPLSSLFHVNLYNNQSLLFCILQLKVVPFKAMLDKRHILKSEVNIPKIDIEQIIL